MDQEKYWRVFFDIYNDLPRGGPGDVAQCLIGEVREESLRSLQIGRGPAFRLSIGVFRRDPACSVGDRCEIR